MSAQSLSFPEVLEEEYRYFFDDQPFRAIAFDRRQVREVAGLAHFLETLFRQGCASSSRWYLLAKRCFGPDGTMSRTDSREDAVLEALNEMLRDPALLEHLAADEHFREELIARPALQQCCASRRPDVCCWAAPIWRRRWRRTPSSTPSPAVVRRSGFCRMALSGMRSASIPCSSAPSATTAAFRARWSATKRCVRTS